MRTTLVSGKKDETVYPKVLVVGMSRTGTSSMKKALEIIYSAPVYHMSVILNKPQHLKFWSDLAFGRFSPQSVDWKQFFRGYVAVTDLPSAYFFQSISKDFPDAKIILSLRDEQEWVNSYCRLMESGQRFRLFKFLPPLNRLWPFAEQMTRLVFGKLIVSEDGIDRSAILAGYLKHNENVRSFFAQENILEFDVRQGWEPLCKFLNTEIPAASFPFQNAGAEGPAKLIANAVSRFSLVPISLVIGGLLLLVLLLR